MGTTTWHMGPRLDDRIRDYPEDDVWDADVSDKGAWDNDDTDSFPESEYGWTGWPTEFRWRPVTAILGAVVAIGAIATAVIINSGDSATTKATLGAPVPTVTSTTPSSAAPKTSAPPSASPTRTLPPETLTTLPPRSASTVPPTAPLVPTPTAAPPPAVAAPPAATLDPRTVVYSVTGSKQLLDLVNVVYTDAQGYPQTEFNVSLPWSKMIVLNPGVQTVSVVATSFYGRLNCSVVNASGQTVVASANNGPLATCTR
ncbi:MmpS family transport accessory protein [Mycobacterium sp. Marseille-P9652]|uniref:MmpS family transport accessory protein n=1 Tax=Mycobacterium sp. Marseille-P9652 TaxID=2654950 RepID=UPI0012E79745|nr:MmpS family transport accessory protein [Mycobacterium sp. Marseille-P9652]